MTDSYHSYPLKIAKTFRFPNELGVYMMDASPGILSGDRYEQSWHFGEKTNVFITNQSYTKVHPAVRGSGETSRQTVRLALERGADVEYMPEPLMLYKDARLHNETDIVMQPGSRLIMSELLSPGRLHRGECFDYELYRSRMTVTYDGEPVFHAKQLFEPARMRREEPGSWESFTHLAALYVFAEQANAEAVRHLRGELNELSAALAAEGRFIYAGVSSAVRHGIIVTALGRRALDLQLLLDTAWGTVRRHMFGKPPLLVPK